MSYSPVQTGPVPLAYPHYGASIGDAFTRFWKKYATFSGRASRSEFWWWYLIGIVISGVLFAIARATGGIEMVGGTAMQPAGPGAFPYYLWGLATLVPNLALTWRRLHDTNRTGLWVLIGLVPLVGAIVLLVFLVSGPNPEGQRFDR